MSKDNTLLRQWEMLRLIPRYPSQITASQLTEKLKDRGYDINKRSVERDLWSFVELFGLQVDDRDRTYGWSWPRDAAIWNLPAMNDEQALSLYMLERHIKDMLPPTVLDSLSPLLKAARERLKSSHNAKALKDWPDKVRARAPAQPLKPCPINPKVHEAVSLALLNNQWLQVSYQGRGRTEAKEHIISPLAYVMRGPMLYLVCRYEGYDDTRILTVCRIKKAARLDRTFSRPEDFSIDTYLAEGHMDFGDGDQIKIELLFDPDSGRHLYETPLSDDQVISESKDGRLRVIATVADTLQLKWWILGLGHYVEVVKPASLRKAIQEEIAGMHSLYKTR